MPGVCIIVLKDLRFSTVIFKYRCRANLISDTKESEEMIRKVLLVLALIVVVFSLVSCQTVQGLGEDIKWVGEKAAEIVE